MKILLIYAIVFFTFIFNVSAMTHLQAFGDNLISQKYPNTMKLSIQSTPDQLNLIPPQDRQIHLKFFDANTTNPVGNVAFVMIVTKGNQTFLQNTFWTQSGSFTLNLKPGERYLWTANPDHDPMDGLYYSKGDQIDIATSYLTEEAYHFSIQPVVVNQNDLRQQNVGGKFTTDLNLLSTYNETLTPNANIMSSVNPLEIPSPLKQFKSGIAAKDVQCKAGLQFIMKNENGQPACVTPHTFDELITRGWGIIPLGGLPTYHNTSIFDTGIYPFSINVANTNFTLNYNISGNNKLIDANMYAQKTSLVLSMHTSSNGTLSVSIPRALLDSNLYPDTHFIVLVDKKEVNFTETVSLTARTLIIPFEYGAETMEIIAPQRI